MTSSITRLLLCIFTTAVASDHCPLKVCRCYTKSAGMKRFIDCENLQLSSVPAINESTEIFSYVSFRGNDIKQLTVEQFQGLKTIGLDLLGNKLESVSERAFSGMASGLEDLSLEGGTNIAAPIQYLQSLVYLKKLRLKSFYLRGLDSQNNFNFAPSLISLRLLDVAISYVTGQAFTANRNLTFLQIDACLINASFPVTAIGKLSRLQQLHWTGNGLHVVYYKSFKNLSHLKFLDLSRNPIQEYESGCFLTIHTSLEYLILSRTGLDAGKLAKLSEYYWQKLRHLDVANNNIRDIPMRIFETMPFLTSLDLSWNKLATLSGHYFSNIRALRSLDLSGNYFVSVDAATLFHASEIQTINLNHVIHPVSWSFSACGTTSDLSLKELNIKGTSLKDNGFWKNLQCFKNLEVLNLENANVSHVSDDAFVNNSKLRTVNLSGNRISRLTRFTFSGLQKSLEELSVKNNLLTSVDKCIFREFENLKMIQFAGNLLRCDCHLKWMYDWFKTKAVKNVTSDHAEINDVVCASPYELRNKRLVSLPEVKQCEGEIKCESGEETSSVNDSAISQQHFYILIIMLLALCLSFCIIFGVVRVMLKKKRSKAEKAINAMYKRSRKESSDVEHVN